MNGKYFSRQKLYFASLEVYHISRLDSIARLSSWEIYSPWEISVYCMTKCHVCITFAVLDFPNSISSKVNDLLVSFKESKYTLFNFSILNIKGKIKS